MWMEVHYLCMGKTRPVFSHTHTLTHNAHTLTHSTHTHAHHTHTFIHNTHSHLQGMDTTDGKIKLISEVINSLLEVDVSVLMGANIALDVAQGDFCESTIGSRSEEQGALLKSIFNRSTFKVNVVSDVAAVELCGALKVGVV